MMDDERGSALVEFIALGVGVLVPLVYVVLAAAAVQSGVYASTQAVREAGRAFVTSADPRQAQERALVAARLSFDDFGIVLPSDALTITCSGGPCLSPGSAVSVDLDWSVALPWLPDSLAGVAPTLIPVRAHHRVPVDDYRGSPV